MRRVGNPVFGIVGAALLVACSSDEPPRDAAVDTGPPRACDDACFAAATPVGTYVINTLALGAMDSGSGDSTVAGVNLDGVVGPGDGDVSCGADDYTSPPPDSEAGVDNVFGPAYRTLFGSGGIDYAPNIGDGEVLIVLDVREDTLFRYVELWAVRTPDGGPPEFASGSLAPGQSFAPVRSMGRMVGTVDGARTRVGPDDVFMPLSPIADDLVLMAAARLRGDVAPDGIHAGIIGGAVAVEDAVDPLVAAGISSAGDVESILYSLADLSPDLMGECRRVSIGWSFTAIPASLDAR